MDTQRTWSKIRGVFPRCFHVLNEAVVQCKVLLALRGRVAVLVHELVEVASGPEARPFRVDLQPGRHHVVLRVGQGGARGNDDRKNNDESHGR